MDLFRIFATVSLLGLVSCGLQLLAALSVIRAGRRAAPERAGASPHLPPVSVLKPLRGLDDNLFDNLESFCNQDYPEYELIFSLQDRNDPAFKIASKIKDKYPEKNITVPVGRSSQGLTPKLTTLPPPSRASRFDTTPTGDSTAMSG